MGSKLRIIVTGLIAQHPHLGGVAWDYGQYVQGLAHLGHEVYYFEDSGEWPYTIDGGPTGNDWIAQDCRPNVQCLASVMSYLGMTGRWAYRFPITGEWFGLSQEKRKAVIESADLLINVSGSLERPHEYRRSKRMVYIDTDPVFTQVKLAAGDREFRARVDAHDVHFSLGERISSAPVPQTGHNWRPTRPPIVLANWRTSDLQRNVYTTVMSWTSYKPLAYRGGMIGQKDLEFKRVLELPDRVAPIAVEVALGTLRHANWERDDDGLATPVAALMRSHPEWTTRDFLVHAGWRVVDAIESCSELHSYRRYVETSKGEFSVAKHGYVVGQPGWFSCRSACYLASARPVIAQDTGFASVIPVGQGILPFQTLDEAASAIREVENDYPRHSRAARAIAEEFFDSRKVLGRLVEESMSCDAAEC
ncbi:MAG: hypothetical protein HYY30_04870 [Chloroflexi bacterium]|nr:hypothetical protein [Chloroflexota bacterium]